MAGREVAPLSEFDAGFEESVAPQDYPRTGCVDPILKLEFGRGVDWNRCKLCAAFRVAGKFAEIGELRCAG